MGPSCTALTLAGPFIDQKLVAFLTAALKAAHRVPADVVATAIVQLALVDICREGRQNVPLHRPAESSDTSKRAVGLW